MLTTGNFAYHKRADKSPVLLGSTVKLEKVAVGNGRLEYALEGFGRNVLEFRGVNDQPISIRDAKSRSVPFKRTDSEARSYIEFEGWGRFTAELK